MKHISALVLTALTAAGVANVASAIDTSKLPPPSARKDVTYAKDIKPLLDTSCIRCHGSERPKAGLRLDSFEGILKGSKEGPVVVKGDSAKSFIVEAISQLDPETAMPPKPRGGRGGRGASGGARGTNAPSAGAQGQRPGGPGGGNFAPPKPLTAEQVGLVRAWIDQGAK